MVRDCYRCLLCKRPRGRWPAALTRPRGPLELTNGQFSLMISLNGPEPPPIRAVASLLAMDRTTFTAALNPLQRRVLVKVQPDPADRRSRLLTLRPKARGLLALAVPVWNSPVARLKIRFRMATPTGSERTYALSPEHLPCQRLKTRFLG
jgi:DNA-binding MarR family transcriptional regulator